MPRPAAWLIAGQLVATGLSGQQDDQLRAALDSYLALAPMKVEFRYELAQGDFRRDTTGTMFLFDHDGFRLELWDKVYGSDGTSLYLYDRNTRQTVIDSLRWPEVNLWLRLLHGELPAGTKVTAAGRAASGAVLWQLRHDQPRWVAEVAIDTASWSLREVQLDESGGFSHRLRFVPPVPWDGQHPRALMTLQDLGGQRLDLR